jgi:hypothetical protein
MSRHTIHNKNARNSQNGSYKEDERNLFISIHRYVYRSENEARTTAITCLSIEVVYGVSRHFPPHQYPVAAEGGLAPADPFFRAQRAMTAFLGLVGLLGITSFLYVGRSEFIFYPNEK